MKAFLSVIAVIIAAISLACGQPSASETPTVPRPQPTSVGVTNRESSSNQETESAPGRRSAVTSIITEIVAAFDGKDGEDLTSLLEEAEERVNDQERFESYRGAWQYMRLLYCQQGKRPDQRALIEKVEALAKQFGQYRAEEFDISSKC